MTNRLANANSPYLLQHKENPVNWFPWGPEALEKAKAEDKPIFLSIGYAACHWCHVMEHESFEDDATAALMNEHFVNIKVDREERPDIDGIYMKAVVAMTGHGGWPMSVFLTPEGEPFYGGTYFPPVPRHNMPSFKDVLAAIAHLWENDRQKAFDNGQKLVAHIQNEMGSLPRGQQLDPDVLDQAAMKLAQNYDWNYGGWGRAPKFPQAMTIEFLLRRATRGDKMALDMATHALDAMAKGGMYDVVGGGFARYSVDDEWLVPHFEKMLYDNAQLAQVYLHAWLITKKPRYREIVEETLDFIAREMTDKLGGFYSSLDADSEGEEGKFYVWTPAELAEAISDPADLAFLTQAYGVTEQGNFEGQTVLQRALDDPALSKVTGTPVEQIPARLKAIHGALLAYRGSRVRPGTDDKVLTMWNALMASAFSLAGRYLREDYGLLATRNLGFLIDSLYEGGRLLRSWRAGDAGPMARHNAYLEDYAALVLALLTHYQSDADPRWFAQARKLADEMMKNFADPDGGFFDTRADHETLVVRPKDLQDNATPSGNSLAACALLQLAAFTDEGKYRDAAEASLGALQRVLSQYPTAFGQWLHAFDFAVGPVDEVALMGADSPERNALIEVLREQYDPRMVVAISEVPPAPDAPPLTADRPLIDEKPTAYVCEGFVCQQPVTTVAELRGLIARGN